MTLDRPEQLLAALILEALFGYPPGLSHPIGWTGRLIAAFDRYWNNAKRARTTIRTRTMGIATAAALIILGAGIGIAIEALAKGWIGMVAVILIATTGLAQRSLHDHVTAVAAPLLAGELASARRAVAMVVGRDTETLGAPGIAAAATETLAESFCDGVVAPVFWFLLLGLPGLFAFKCVSTADSMIGHMNDRYRNFGWASARADDIMNWLPARISGVLICIAGNGGWRIMRRDAGKHLSPNSGWPESAMAGALDVQLGGGTAYDGHWIARANLGDGARPSPTDVQRALCVYRRACLALWCIIGAVICLR